MYIYYNNIDTFPQTNMGLTQLDISWNGFGNEGAKAVGEALKHNRSLELLDLSNNRIRANGAIILSSGLQNNNTLKILKVNL